MGQKWSDSICTLADLMIKVNSFDDLTKITSVNLIHNGLKGVFKGFNCNNVMILLINLSLLYMYVSDVLRITICACDT